MYYGYFAIDNWHLTGGHFPDVRGTHICITVGDIVDELMELTKFYTLEDANHNVIDRKYIEDIFNSSDYTYRRVHFEYPREGEITLVCGL